MIRRCFDVIAITSRKSPSVCAEEAAAGTGGEQQTSCEISASLQCGAKTLYLQPLISPVENRAQARLVAVRVLAIYTDAGSSLEVHMTIMRTLPAMTPDNTALVIVDMQHDFLDDGAPCTVKDGRRIIPALQQLLRECRSLKVPVIHVHTVWQKDGADMPPFTTSEEFKVRGLRLGAPGTAIIPELAPVQNEPVVIKKRYSGFYLTDLEMQLRCLGVTYVIVGGVATAFCVRATVQDACYRDFVAVVARECVTSDTPEEHEQSLKDIQKGFGQVKSLDEVIRALRSERPAAARQVG